MKPKENKKSEGRNHNATQTGASWLQTIFFGGQLYLSKWNAKKAIRSSTFMHRS